MRELHATGAAIVYRHAPERRIEHTLYRHKRAAGSSGHGYGRAGRAGDYHALIRSKDSGAVSALKYLFWGYSSCAPCGPDEVEVKMSAQLKINQFSLLEDEECDARIRAAKAMLGKRLAILGHHYQRDEVFRHADYSGDSLKLSRQAAESDAEFIVFCGVHFMAEVADIVTYGKRTVMLPDLAAGCSMADMASLPDVVKCWKELQQVLDPDQEVTPVTYINSAANLKAFCGEHGGVVCTSSNARGVLEWAWERRPKVLFFPDQNLGRNTAEKMGIPLDDMVEWDFTKPMGGLTADAIRKARIILWKGFCSVHQMFHPKQVEKFRAEYPDGKVISHPENAFEV